MKCIRSLCAVWALAACLAVPALASLDSVKVTTSTWKRSEAGAAFFKGSVKLTLVFEKLLPAKKPASESDGFESQDEAPSIRVEIVYAPPAARATSGASLEALKGLTDSSSLADEEVPGQPIGDVNPEAPLPKRRVLRARVGAAEYRVTGSEPSEELAGFLKALLAGDPVLYRARRQYPAELELIGPKPAVRLYEAPAATDVFALPRPGETPDLCFASDAKTPLTLLFKLRADELVFRKHALGVTSAQARQGVRTYMRCGSTAIYADTGADGVASFELGVVAGPAEWRFQAGLENPVAADWVLPSAGRVLFRIATEAAARPQAPASGSPADVATSLAAFAALKAPSREAVPPELSCLLFAQETDRKSTWTWKAEAFWLGAGQNLASDTSAWLDGQARRIEKDWIGRPAGETSAPSKPGWGAREAAGLLAALRLYELEPGPESLARARALAAGLFATLLATPDPTSTPADAASAPAAHGLAALGFFKANEIFREAGYRRLALDQVQHLLAEHVALDSGAVLATKGGAPLSDLRSHALVVHAIAKAWRSSSKKPYKAALAAIRKRVLASWTAESAFLLSGAKPDLASQFWALSVFTYALWPYWGLDLETWMG